MTEICCDILGFKSGWSRMEVTCALLPPSQIKTMQVSVNYSFPVSPSEEITGLLCKIYCESAVQTVMGSLSQSCLQQIATSKGEGAGLE